MANSIVQVPPDSTGKKIDTESMTVGGNTVERQRVQIAGSSAAAIAPVDATTGLTTDPADRALRDMGKIDVAALDQYTPVDVDSGAGVENALPVSMRKAKSGGSVEYGTSTDPLRTDPTGTTTQPVSGTVTSNQGGAPWSENVTQLAGTAIDTNSGNKSAGTLRVVLATDQPALTNKLLVTPDANSAVNVAQINGVTPLMGAGNTGTGSPRVTIATDQVAVATTPAGNVAHDAADSGSPVKIGFKAETSPKGITLVADGDRTDAYADADGLQMTKLNTSFADIISERVTDTGGTSTAFTNFSAVASTKNYITAITVMRSDAGTSPASVDFRDGAAGAVLWTMPLPPNGGSIIVSAMPLFKTSANTALAYDVSSALTTVTISVSGFQSKV